MTNILGILMASAICAFFIAIVISFPPFLTGPLDYPSVSGDLMFTDNPFSDMRDNWSSGMYSVEYRNIYDDYTIPVTYELVNMLSNDYPCANEQFAVLSKDNVPIAVDIAFTSKVAMSVEITGEITPGSYVLHSHPLQTCGDFAEIDVATFPSPRDLISESSEGVDDIIIVTKMSNTTARASRVTGFMNASDTLDKYDIYGSFLGYDPDVVGRMFDEAGIRYRYFTITVYENKIFVTGD